MTDGRAHREASSETPPPQMRPTACAEVLERVLDRLRPRIGASGASVTWDPLPTVRGDPRQLFQLFHALLDNALKFRSAAAPEIHVGAERLPGHWLFSVRDNGIGMSGECLCRVFATPGRACGRSLASGTHRGLTSCMRILDRCGGRIWAHSRPGLGATIHFTIPVAEDPHEC